MEKTIAILGVGAIGSILTAYLNEARAKLILVERSPRLDQIKENGIKISGIVNKNSKNFTILSSISDLRNHKLDAVFICSKATALSAILPELKKNISEHTVLISFQNGIGTEDEIETYFPKNPVARFVLNFAGNINPETGDISMSWFNPPNILGPHSHCLPEDLNWLENLLNQSGFTTKLVPRDELKKNVFLKAVLNAVLSPYCSISNLTMSEAMKMPSRTIVQQIIKENVSVGKALGYDIDEKTTEQYLDKGGNHYPSMWADFQNKRLTEIDYINGKILEVAKLHKMDLPLNRLIATMIVSVEIKNGLRNPEALPSYLSQVL